jgi:hypothetical protein
LILVKAAAGVVIELAAGDSGLFDVLSIRLPEGLSPAPLRFQLHEGPTGRLRARPLEAREVAELTIYLGVLAAHEPQILAELRKYRPIAG